MSIICENSHRKWKYIVHVLEQAKYSKKRNRSNLRGNQKKKSTEVVYRVCHTGADANKISLAIRAIKSACNKKKGQPKVRVLLSNPINNLLTQLLRSG
jgi:hypothetical protein